MHKKSHRVSGVGVLTGCFFLSCGLGAFLSGITFISSPSPLQTLQCKKNEANQTQCELRNSKILREYVKTFQIYGSKIEQGPTISRKRSGSLPSYRVLMSTSIGQIPWPEYFTGSGAATDNNKINYFVSNSGENYLNIRKDDRLNSFVLGFVGLFGLILGIILLFIGGWILRCTLLGEIY
jgi:hypothetical protein